MESILEVLTPDNLVFIFKGFGLDPLHFSDCHRPRYTYRYSSSSHEKWQKSYLTYYLQHLHRICA